MPAVIRKVSDGWVVVEKATGKRKTRPLSKRKAKIVAAIQNREAGE
jgi:hypothetical protein